MFIEIATEQTTAVTDAIMAVIAIVAALSCKRLGRGQHFGLKVWSWVFMLLALAGILGAAAHGLQMPESLRNLLWQPLFLSLGLLIALFVVAAIQDMFEPRYARRALPIMLILGFGFYGVTLLWPDNFMPFIVYELVAMLLALAGYLYKAIKTQSLSASWLAGGIFTTVVAAGIQASHAVSLTLIWVFDHNGVYHLVQMLAIGFLWRGIFLSAKEAEV